MKSEDTIQRGDVCRCSIGKLGVVTSDGRRHVVYPDGNEGEAYLGICLTDGMPWSSRNPDRLCGMAELKKYLDRAEARAFIDRCQFNYEDDPEEIALQTFLYARSRRAP